MMAPITPHVAEELWARMGHAASLAYEPFPVADPALLVEDSVEYPVQVNGKVRGQVTVGGRGRAASSRPPPWLTPRCRPPWPGGRPRRSSSCPGRLVNIVV